MNKEHEILERYNIIPRKISYKKKLKIIDTNEARYCLKLKESQTNSIYQYLENHNFRNFIPKLNLVSDSYELYPYINEKNLDAETKAIDLIYTLSLLHNKTTTYQEINIDNIKSMYEEIVNKINYLSTYYYDLQDSIENVVYMSPSQYLLIRNVNVLYISLNNARHDIEFWYNIKKKMKNERQVFLHNNASLDHFLAGENNYLINWKKARRGSAVYDFLIFFRNEYNRLEIENLYELYQSKFKYTEDEYYLFKALIQLPWKISFDASNYINTLHVQELLDYLQKANHLISKEDEKNQKTEQKEFS